ncbi:MAG: GNAT family N-acetyltransferase [Candidatus Diapherotrites archaeon]|nr:GNAT family N-acetyltransferase [Candidatus Diapherotrites archaeon]
MPEIKISEARIEDSTGIAKLYPHWGLELSRKRVINSFLSKNEKRYVAKLGDKVIAHLLVKYGIGPHKHIASLHSLIVAKKHRGKGIAQHILKHALKNIRKGTEIVTAQVNDDNAVSLKVFEKLGFVQYGLLEKGTKEGSKYKNLVLLKKEF